MANSIKTGGQLLVETLTRYGVRHAFCVPGESYLAALDALYDCGGAEEIPPGPPLSRAENIRLITCRQEGGAAYMAEAYAKLNGAPGVAFVSRGPGAANAMIGVHTAYQDSTPMLLFIGQVPRAHSGREAFQELEYARVYDGVAKAVFRIERAGDVPQAVHNAWAAAIGGRAGPVVLELPEDMLRETVAPAMAVIPDKPVREAVTPAADAMEKFAALLNEATRPLLVFGGASWTPATNAALAKFATAHALPAACAFRRQDMFDNSHGNFAGELSVQQDANLVRLARESDLVIALAARLGEITTAGYTLFPAPDFADGGARKLVHIHPDANELNSVYAAELGIASDADAFLSAAESIAPTATQERVARVQTAHENYLRYLHAPRYRDAQLRMDEVMKFLREALPADAIITTGAGNYTRWAQRHYRFTMPRTQLACTNGSMGYGVPAGIAAKVLHPNRKVVSFNGDGCFLMNGQELATAVQYRLGVLFLVLNNSCYGTIRSHQRKHYPRRPVATALRNPDFAAVARAYGAFGATVQSTAEFAPAFDAAQAALTAGQPALIELQLDHNDDEPE